MDTQLKKELAGFMFAFEHVFDTDWEHAQTVMGIHDRDQKSDFLVHDNYTDWASHNALVTHYQRLRKEMSAQKISIDDESLWSHPDDETDETYPR